MKKMNINIYENDMKMEEIFITAANINYSRWIKGSCMNVDLDMRL